MKNLPAVSQCVELEQHVALQSPWITEAARHVLGVHVAASDAAGGGPAFVRAADPLAWLRFTGAARSG